MSGLAVLVGMQHRATHLGIAVRLAAPSPLVAKLLHSTGLDRCFIVCAAPSGAPAPQSSQPAHPLPHARPGRAAPREPASG